MWRTALDRVSTLFSLAQKRPPPSDDEDEANVISNAQSEKRARVEEKTTNPEEDVLPIKYIHRVVVSNLPRESIKKTKEFFKQYGITRVNKNPKYCDAYLTFDTEEEAMKAIETINGVVFKKRELRAVYSRISEEDHRNRFNTKSAAAEEEKEEDTRTPAERIADQVTPLHKEPYEKQLIKKDRTAVKQVRKIINQLKLMKGFQEKYRLSWVDKGYASFEIEKAIASPDINGYRSKCEFTIGHDLEGERTVGFKLGLFRHGVTTVLNASECISVSDVTKKIANAMQDYVRASEYDVYNQETHQGVWRLLMTKVQRTGDVMVLVQIQASDLSPEQVTKEKEKLIDFWNGLKDKDEANRVDVTTLILQTWNGESNGAGAGATTEVLTGDGYIHEELLGCRFRISSDAFFQVNTPAAELLYTKCAEWCNIDKSKKTTLLDLCCGTGTIGITMAKSVDKVIGIEMVPEAVEDARANAKRNDIHNVEYFASTVEKRLDVLRATSNEDVVAVLDPPRSGVQSSVIKAIRETEAIDRLIYISCDAKQALQNFIDLCRPTSNNFKQMPFKPRRMVTVDLFPHTDKFELMIEFVRTDQSDLKYGNGEEP